MIKKNKKKIFNKIKKLFKYNNVLYIIDISKFKSNYLLNYRKECYKYNIKLIKIKNKLLKKYLYKKKKKKIINILKKNNFLMFSNNINYPAKIIKNYQIYIKNKIYPKFKLAYIKENDYYKNDKDLNFLSTTKLKEEIIINILNIIKNKIINNILKLINYNKNIIINIIKKLKLKTNDRFKKNS
ncbi:MAG: 50S ribosomal protein L10 [Candidatus Shikimatogenerans sp. JK-2022]|nr:50S ribosomal protein L10 [Candidatus Shikimatogenerans bostrichidophilus]